MTELPTERDPLNQVRLAGCLVMMTLLVFACLVPLIFIDFARTALTNLHLHPATALLVLLGMLLGSVVNLPIARFPTDEEVVVPVFEPIAGWSVLPQYRRLRREMVVAVNVGGCVIPVALAIWMLRFIALGGGQVIATALFGVALNSAICYRLARPIPKLGIALPAFVPPLVALAVAWIALPGEPFENVRAPVAYVIGITGPLIGADLLHWKEFRRIGAGTVSIGGAGTWDGIVLSGLLAAFFA